MPFSKLMHPSGKLEVMGELRLLLEIQKGISILSKKRKHQKRKKKIRKHARALRKVHQVETVHREEVEEKRMEKGTSLYNLGK